jgi:tRNA-2-methylthio-N6-dimethylallyladenosine synthase
MKKVYIETFGCQMNVSDSERIATTLSESGYQITSDESAADVVILNTCSVRERAEHKLYTRVGEIRRSKPKKPIVGITGCVAQLDGETLFEKISGVDFIMGTRATGRVANLVDATLSGKKQIIDLNEREDDYDWTVADTHRHSPYVAFIPIIEGCNKFCTYCIVPFSRGREKSLSAKTIVEQVRELMDKGVRDVHLIGQNVNSYRPSTEEGLEGFSGRSPFTRLLRAVAATGMERIKFTTSFPRDFRDEIVDAIEENENLCNWVHLPVQSGSDRVLSRMKRGHTIGKYLQKIDRIKRSPRNIAITTDVIVGFPGESDDDFEKTIDLFKYCRYDSAYIFKYSPRPGTPAFDMPDDVSPADKTLRFLRLQETQKSIEREALPKKYLNKTLKVLVEGRSARTPNGYTGHSTCHKVVNFVADNDVIGQIVDVRVTEIKSNSLFGEVIQNDAR